MTKYWLSEPATGRCKIYEAVKQCIIKAGQIAPVDKIIISTIKSVFNDGFNKDEKRRRKTFVLFYFSSQ